MMTMASFNKRAIAVIGLGFGDEGKGMMVHSLCLRHKDYQPMVVRFNGGQQAGHTVMPDKDPKNSHVFSNFGSGTLAGAPTYWAEYCTFDPVAFLKEHKVLKAKGVTPVIYIDKKCPITTPYEKHLNKKERSYIQNGTCGMGVGATIQREEDSYSLLVGDMLYKDVFDIKFKLLSKKYTALDQTLPFHCNHHNYLKMKDEYEKEFKEACKKIQDLEGVNFVKGLPIDWCHNDRKNKYTYILEGAQGLMLDQNFGFFPHVTRSNTGTKNIIKMGFTPHVFLMTRCYQTRHGNGPMIESGEFMEEYHKKNTYEINENNKFQGDFKIDILDLDLLKYACSRDDFLNRRGGQIKTLVMTCMDIPIYSYHYRKNGKVSFYDVSSKDQFVDMVASHIGVDNVIVKSCPWDSNAKSRSVE